MWLAFLHRLCNRFALPLFFYLPNFSPRSFPTHTSHHSRRRPFLSIYKKKIFFTRCANYSSITHSNYLSNPQVMAVFLCLGASAPCVLQDPSVLALLADVTCAVDATNPNQASNLAK